MGMGYRVGTECEDYRSPNIQMLFNKVNFGFCLLKNFFCNSVPKLNNLDFLSIIFVYVYQIRQMFITCLFKALSTGGNKKNKVVYILKQDCNLERRLRHNYVKNLSIELTV